MLLPPFEGNLEFLLGTGLSFPGWRSESLPEDSNENVVIGNLSVDYLSRSPQFRRYLALPTDKVYPNTRVGNKCVQRPIQLIGDALKGVPFNLNIAR